MKTILFFRDREECESDDIMLRPLSSDPSPGSAVEFEIIVPSTTCNNTYIEMPFIESVF